MPYVYAIEAIVFAGLYLVGLFIIGLVDHHQAVVNLALAATAIVYLSGFIGLIYQTSPPPRPSILMVIQILLVMLSIVFGGSAGLALLLG